MTPISVQDVTTKIVDENYWKHLSETRRCALNDTLTENQKLKVKIASMENELRNDKVRLVEIRANIEKLKSLSC